MVVHGDNGDNDVHYANSTHVESVLTTTSTIMQSRFAIGSFNPSTSTATTTILNDQQLEEQLVPPKRDMELLLRIESLEKELDQVRASTSTSATSDQQPASLSKSKAKTSKKPTAGKNTFSMGSLNKLLSGIKRRTDWQQLSSSSNSSSDLELVLSDLEFLAMVERIGAKIISSSQSTFSTTTTIIHILKTSTTNLLQIIPILLSTIKSYSIQSSSSTSQSIFELPDLSSEISNLILDTGTGFSSNDMGYVFFVVLYAVIGNCCNVVDREDGDVGLILETLFYYNQMLGMGYHILKVKLDGIKRERMFNVVEVGLSDAITERLDSCEDYILRGSLKREYFVLSMLENVRKVKTLLTRN
ncbi:hypothetical protein HDU76_003928 [Blyttiomyces sp. JEL0837]|nr:hypothetical protein HDU76_003928 [Blyttiomyces sp. JEL0837]